ncbi:hypothetical protein SteCoe_32395 [Stentor coeruleus]|uniref:Alcohol dehydrogenase-like N-terminal domain-containing protein n=1 Tax=Stentor coeruleus TaxID=5963 RepID=A0A1R2AZH5_9CILI|nr:hypothetical protein SteCoe_32395 [Stentor coeruleus]
MPMPIPGSGQALIKVHVSPISYQDIDTIQKSNPCTLISTVLGIEGSGVVIQENKSIFSKKNKGKKVSFMVLDSFLPGTWAEYVICDEKCFMVLNDNIDFLHGCSLMLNPLTIFMMHERIKKNNHKSVVFTNSGTDLGVMFIKWCHFNNLISIHIVQTGTEKAKLEVLAVENVLVIESENFNEDLQSLISKLNPTIAFDSIGGSLAGAIFNLMPENSEFYLYGNISDEPIQGLNPTSFIFSGKTLKGLRFKEWFDDLNTLKRYKYYKKIQKIHFVFTTTISTVYPIPQYQEALSNFSPLGSSLLHFACTHHNNSQYQSEDILSQYINEQLKGRINSLPILNCEIPDCYIKVISEGIYKGNFVDYKPQGPGILLSDDDFYIGNFNNGAKNGFGRLVRPIHWYEGEFYDNQFNGQGKLKTYSGHSFEGNFINGTLSGVGIEILPNGEIYKGEFLNMLRHGRGEIEFNNNHFVGVFFKGLAEGPGHLTLSNSSTFTGNYQKGVGIGILTKSDGTSIPGTILGFNFTETLKDNQ